MIAELILSYARNQRQFSVDPAKPPSTMAFTSLSSMYPIMSSRSNACPPKPRPWGLFALAATALAGLLAVPNHAEARWYTYGKGVGGVNSGTRSPNGTVFEVRTSADTNTGTSPSNIHTRFIIDSSLPNTEWWAQQGNQGQPWLSVRSQNVTGDFFATQFRDGVVAGGSFYFGFSWQNSINEPRNSHRITSNGTSYVNTVNPATTTNRALPPGTVIYIGISNLGAPANTLASHFSGVTLSGAIVSTPGGPPSGTFDGNTNAFRWFSSTVPATLTGAGDITFTYQPPSSVSYSELVYVVVLPSNWAYVPGATDASRLNFSWTVDGRGANNGLGPLNPGYGNILVPEPGRAVLITMALAFLAIRRSRR